jgi:transcription termination/antitermination protein NusG
VAAAGKEPEGETVLARASHDLEPPADPGILTPPADAIVPPGEFDRLVHSGWYALYTRSRHEKKLLSELTDRSIDVFLPMREVLSRWKDRKKRIWLPLFPGYLFVHQVDTPENRFRVLNMPGAVRFVGHEGHAERIPDEQIDAIRRFLETKIAIDPYPYIRMGQRVEIIAGPLKGIQGILIQKKGRFRFVLRVDLIRQAVSIEIDASDIRPL